MECLTDKAPDLERVYRKFESRATLGDWLFFSERLAKDPSDSRNMSYSAVQRLGLSTGDVQFSADPQYMMLELLYTVNRQVKLSLEGDRSEGAIAMMGGKLQTLMLTIQQYELFNQSLSDEKRVNYRKSVGQYVDPLKVDPEVMRGISDPAEAINSFSSLYEADPQACLGLVRKYVAYADYLHNVAARKRVGGRTLKQCVKRAVSPLAQEYKQRAIEREDAVAQQKMACEMQDILSGRAYRYMAEMAGTF